MVGQMCEVQTLPAKSGQGGAEQDRKMVPPPVAWVTIVVWAIVAHQTQVKVVGMGAQKMMVEVKMAGSVTAMAMVRVKVAGLANEMVTMKEKIAVKKLKERVDNGASTDS